jgi:hypothetical protein
VQPDQLIAELIATGTMNPDTLADLERMRADYAAGRLEPDDESYLRALHARITGAPAPEPVDETGPARLDGLTIAEWRERALRAESELAVLREQQTSEAASAS